MVQLLPLKNLKMKIDKVAGFHGTYIHMFFVTSYHIMSISSSQSRPVFPPPFFSIMPARKGRNNIFFKLNPLKNSLKHLLREKREIIPTTVETMS